MKIKKGFTILGIDTSCDETSVAVTQDDRVLSNVIASQVEFHKPYGGVYPILAKRKHQEFIDPTIEEALRKARKKITDIDAFAVTVGAGLAPALEVGIARIKELAREHGKRIVAVNHMEAHFLSSLAKNSQGNGPLSKTKIEFPVLGLLVSGGHTQLILMKKIGQYQILGETIDDAAGEAFDKVAKMLNLGYPGGPIISEFAKKGKPIYELPLTMANSNDLNYSFSGLKTACLYKIRDLQKKEKFNQEFYYNFAASFERAVIKSLMLKFKKAIISFKPKQVFLGGGVMSNERLRRSVRRVAGEYGVKVFQPYSEKLFTDNGAMVGICAFYQAQRKDFVKDIEELDRQPNLNF